MEDNSMGETLSQGEIVVYATRWCFDCKRSEKFLNKNRIDFRKVDIDQDQEGREFVMKVNDGSRSVPTIVFPDGSILVEPSNDELAEKLGLE
jgi:glutaredoxin-like protein